MTRALRQPSHNRRNIQPARGWEAFASDTSVPKFARHDELAEAVMAEGGHSRVEESPGRKRLVAADGSILREWAA